MSEQKAYYTDDELVQKVIDNEAVKTVMAKHAYLLSGGQRRRELEELWVKLPQNRRTASLGLNTGFYVGFDEISNYYVVQNNDLRYQKLEAYSKADPEIACNNLNLGLGELIIHSANTPVIYVSDDGRTAKYMAFDFGLYTTGKPDGDCDAYFTSGNVFCELLEEKAARGRPGGRSVRRTHRPAQGLRSHVRLGASVSGHAHGLLFLRRHAQLRPGGGYGHDLL